ncbi:hypothetical protein POTOM_039218 [Populus tomentosa]|uniref:Uncharacterized protein n=1 Tax=Populus tomentosa TaxID=118781 RepID=A0A8X8CJ57_POPTO|nr:hypothetical protein POTOM_039218 [Populus tomentosa]
MGKFLKRQGTSNSSHNNFLGQIPSSMMNLTEVESLDLSKNQLSAEIPPQLTKRRVGSHFDEMPCEDKLCFVENVNSVLTLLEISIGMSTDFEQAVASIASSLSAAPKAAHHRCRDDQRSAFAQLQENLKFQVLFVPLSKLHFLSELHLDSNSELSSIPPSFLANSSNLETLDLSYCGLNGSFPNNIFLLPKLQYIDLSENSLLSGQFPEFSLNSSIQSLLLKNTNFSGNIPLSISNLKSLKELDLSRCKFYGAIPQSLANLTQLEYLDLSFNSFNGSIPPFQSDGVANLSSLSLEHNQLNGILYSSLFTLPSLQNLDLSSNQLSGQLDEFSDGSSSLLMIELSNNNLSGSIPRSIFNLPSLTELNLLYNKFSGPLKLGDFKNQRDLEFLAISGVSVESDNRSLAYVQLATLYLPSCNLTEFPNFLKTQNSLTLLDLSNNRIQGYVPSWIWKTTLTTLYLSRNPVDFPKIPPFVKVNHSTPIYNEDGVSSFPMTLETLGMSSCNITGSFPEFIKNQETLVYLDLSDNKLGGQIPKWIWNMSLKYLNLSCNNFDFLDQFSNPISLPYSDTLITLDLHANKLPGSFPKAICNCSQLSLLDMSHNQLRSEIPDCLGKVPTLTSLVGMQLTSNNESKARLTFLAVMNLSYNHLEGRIPQGNQFFTFPNSSYEGNPRLCGFPLTRKCKPEVNEPATPPADHEDSWTEYILDWKIVGIGYASGIREMVQPRPEESSKLVMKLMLVNAAYKLLSPGCKSLMHHIDEEWSVILSFKLVCKLTSFPLGSISHEFEFEFPLHNLSFENLVFIS